MCRYTGDLASLGLCSWKHGAGLIVERSDAPDGGGIEPQGLAAAGDETSAALRCTWTTTVCAGQDGAAEPPISLSTETENWSTEPAWRVSWHQDGRTVRICLRVAEAWASPPGTAWA